MKKILTGIGQWTVGLSVYAAIVYSLYLTGRIYEIWIITVIAMATFVVLCYIAPDLMTRLISMPRAFKVEENVGTDALEWQCVTYAAYHTNWFSNMTHAGFFFDGVAWHVVAYYFGGPWALVPLLAWHAYQSSTFQEKRFGGILFLSWVGIAGLAATLHRAVGPEQAYVVAQYVLVSMGVFRFVGHWTEPIPPDVVGNRTFLDMKDFKPSLRILPPLILGSLAEFTAGLPFRLYNFWLYGQLQRVFGFQSHQITLQEIGQERDLVLEDGWAASKKTAHLAHNQG